MIHWFSLTFDWNRKALVFLVPFLLVGCASPALDLPDPPTRFKSAAAEILYSDIPKSRNLKKHQMLPAVGRVLDRVRAAAVETCLNLRPPPYEQCEAVEQAWVKVYTGEKDVNAFANLENEVGVFGGLVKEMGSDDEIAAVLAHEFAHIIFDHPAKKLSNQRAGAIMGAVLAGAILAAGATEDTFSRNMIEGGAAAGGRAYSPEMEIEADRAAIYILKRAGYPPTGMRNAIVRLSQLAIKKKRGSFRGTVGFMQTHPSDERRISNILWGIDNANTGWPLSTWQKR